MALVTRPNTDTNWAEGGNTVEPSTEKQELGWTIEKPPNEIMNWIHNKQDKAVQYFLQEGISDWNSSQDYSNSSVVKYNKVVYKAKLASKGKQPDTETSVWEVAFAPYSVATDLDKVKNTVNYAAKLVYKEAPVFTATATGTAYLAQVGSQVNKGYSFVGKTTDGLFHNTSPVILKNGVEVARFESLSNQTDSSKKVVTTDWLQSLISTLKQELAPTGSIVAMATRVIPSGYLECNGNTVSRTTYPLLFSKIGTTFGNGDGSTTFNLPDLRGEFIRGFDSGRGIDASRNFGSGQSAAIESHYHGTEQIGFDATGNGTGNPDRIAYGDNAPYNGLTKTMYYGGTETRPRNVALVYIIKT